MLKKTTVINPFIKTTTIFSPVIRVYHVYKKKIYISINLNLAAYAA